MNITAGQNVSWIPRIDAFSKSVCCDSVDELVKVLSFKKLILLFAKAFFWCFLLHVVFYYTMPIFSQMILTIHAVQKMKFFIKDFFIKCDQIRNFQQIWSHLLEKFLLKKIGFLRSEWK